MFHRKFKTMSAIAGKEEVYIILLNAAICLFDNASKCINMN